MLRRKIILGALALGIFGVEAMEPLQDRARVFSMNAELMLPDRTYIDVDMSFDCGSAYADTAMIVTSTAGAEILAAAYTALWGKKYGEAVMFMWNNKAKDTDPRKPTFIVVTTPPKKSSISSAKMLSASGDDVNPMPQLIATCGTIDHDPNGSKP